MDMDKDQDHKYAKLAFKLKQDREKAMVVYEQRTKEQAERWKLQAKVRAQQRRQLKNTEMDDATTRESNGLPKQSAPVVCVEQMRRGKNQTVNSASDRELKEQQTMAE